MLWSKAFIPTLREEQVPTSVADPAQRLLIRAGHIRRLPSGEIAYLPLARRVLRKIVPIIREEMDAIGAQEILVPAGQSMGKLADEIRSPKQLPQIWYQFQTALEGFIVGATEETRRQVQRAFRRIFDRCELRYEAAGTRLVAISESGADTVVRGANYLAALEEAETVPTPPIAPDPEGDFAPEEFHTPKVKSIAEIAALTGLPETSQIKSLVMMADGKPVLALLRGDHQLSEWKLANLIEADVRPATSEELRESFGADAGSLGPAGVNGIRILADNALRGRRNMIAGANRNDYHLRNVTPGKDFECEYADLRLATADGAVRFEKAREIARADKLKLVLHIQELLFALAEQNHDKDGLLWPASIAPFDQVITPVFIADPVQRQIAFDLYEAARAKGLDVLLDDRDERPGVKFKDADLIGIPTRINIGKKAADGIVEQIDRRTKTVKEVRIPPKPETVPEPEP